MVRKLYCVDRLSLISNSWIHESNMQLNEVCPELVMAFSCGWGWGCFVSGKINLET